MRSATTLASFSCLLLGVSACSAEFIGSPAAPAESEEANLIISEGALQLTIDNKVRFGPRPRARAGRQRTREPRFEQRV